LNGSRILLIVRQFKAAAVPELVGVHREAQLRHARRRARSSCGRSNRSVGLCAPRERRMPRRRVHGSSAGAARESRLRLRDGCSALHASDDAHGQTPGRGRADPSVRQ
jgi:hypothetical protein